MLPQYPPHGSTRPSIQTDVLQTLSLESPITPYFETNSSSPTPPTANSWDLNVFHPYQGAILRVPPHLVLPLIVSDDSYLSNMYTNYVAGARQLLDNGAPVTEVLGASDEVPLDLFFRSRAETDDWSCASWACEVSGALVELEEGVRLASVYLLTFMMRVCCCCSYDFTSMADYYDRSGCSFQRRKII